MSKRRRSRRAERRRQVSPKVAAFAGGGLLVMLALILLVARGGDPAGAYARAEAFAEAGDMASARVEAMNAVQAEPGNEEAWLLLARTQLALGDGQGAAGTVARAQSAGVAAARTRHLSAEAALLQGDSAAALAEASSEDIAPEFQDEAARMRARALHAQGNPQGAADAFNLAIELDPESSDLWLDIARFRMDNGELRSAIEAIDRSVELDETNIEALVLKGRLVRSQYGMVASLAWFDQALAINPEYMPALFERAKTLGEVGRYSEMLAETRAILEAEPGNADALYLQAVLAARARNFRLARRIVEQIDGRLDRMAGMQLLHAGIAYEEQNYETAIRWLTDLTGYQPANRNALRLLAASQFRSGDMAAVIDTLGPLANRGDADSYMLTLMGRALERQGEFERAVPYLERAANAGGHATMPIGRPPADAAELAVLERAARDGDAPAQVALIRAYLAIGRGGDALARAGQLAAQNPDAPDALILYGDLLGAQGRFAEAATAYADAANIRFNEATALRLIEALQRSGQGDVAVQTLALYRQQNPRNTSTALLSAQLNLNAGRWRQAAAILEQVRRRIGDRDAAILANLALASHELGQADRAAALARRAYILMPRNAAVSEIFGWVLFDSGNDRPRGLALLEKAVALAPDNPGAQWHLARAYASVGRNEDARLAVRAALAQPRFAARSEAEAMLTQL